MRLNVCVLRTTGSYAPFWLYLSIVKGNKYDVGWLGFKRYLPDYPAKPIIWFYPSLNRYQFKCVRYDLRVLNYDNILRILARNKNSVNKSGLGFYKKWVYNLALSLMSKPQWRTIYTVCPGSSDPPEKIFNIYLHQKMRFKPFINYYNTLGWILFIF